MVRVVITAFGEHPQFNFVGFTGLGSKEKNLAAADAFIQRYNSMMGGASAGRAAAVLVDEIDR